MAQALEPTYAESGQIQFELDKLELTGNRLTVSGRWFGVRGRRFVRPTLTLRSGGERTRSLADLEHKPWTANDAEPWTAAFPCERGLTGVDEVELAVAPDVAVSLPAPDSPPRQAGASRLAVKPPPSPPREPEDAFEIRLREERGRAEDARTELQAALARRDAAVAKLDAVIDERDQAVAAAERARRERDEAAVAAERAGRERDAALHSRDVALRDRQGALREREQALREREAALRERERAIERFRRLRASAQARLAQLQDQVRREPRPARPAAAPSRQSDWLARGLALAVFLAVVIALLIVLQSP